MRKFNRKIKKGSFKKFKEIDVQVQNQKQTFDLTLMGSVLVLVLFGLVMVYNVSAVEAFANFGDRYFFIKQQLIWVIFGFLAMFFLSYFPYHHFKKIAWPLFLGSLLLLFLVFLPGFGVAAGGAHRWLKILNFTIQPTEIIKLTSVIFFAAIFQDKVKTFPFILILTVVATVIGLFQKDLGSTLVYVITALGIYLIAGAPILYFLILSPLALVGAVIFILSSPYRRERVLAFLDPFADREGYTYHISQILIALGSGGLLGLGLGQSRQKYSFIPEVTTDSIFAVVGEELGFLGGIVVIFLFGLFIFRGFKIAQDCRDQFGKLLSSGLILWLGIQIIINLAATVSLIPLTGVPLPFISYGGSALLANMIGVGILLNISKSQRR